jgi:hypothetical protein
VVHEFVGENFSESLRVNGDHRVITAFLDLIDLLLGVGPHRSHVYREGHDPNREMKITHRQRPHDFSPRR